MNKYSEKHHQAAIFIQSFIRGYQTRIQFNQFLIERYQELYMCQNEFSEYQNEISSSKFEKQQKPSGQKDEHQKIKKAQNLNYNQNQQQQQNMIPTVWQGKDVRELVRQLTENSSSNFSGDGERLQENNKNKNNQQAFKNKKSIQASSAESMYYEEENKSTMQNNSKKNKQNNNNNQFENGKFKTPLNKKLQMQAQIHSDIIQNNKNQYKNNDSREDNSFLNFDQNNNHGQGNLKFSSIKNCSDNVIQSQKPFISESLQKFNQYLANPLENSFDINIESEQENNQAQTFKQRSDSFEMQLNAIKEMQNTQNRKRSSIKYNQKYNDIIKPNHCLLNSNMVQNYAKNDFVESNKNFSLLSYKSNLQQFIKQVDNDHDIYNGFQNTFNNYQKENDKNFVNKINKNIPNLNLNKFNKQNIKVNSFYRDNSAKSFVSPRLQPDLYDFDVFIKAATIIQKVFRGHHSRKRIMDYYFIKKVVLKIEKFFYKVKDIKRKKLKDSVQNIELAASELIKLVKVYEKGEKETTKFFNQQKNLQKVIIRSRTKLQETFAKFIKNNFIDYKIPFPKILNQLDNQQQNSNSVNQLMIQKEQKQFFLENQNQILKQKYQKQQIQFEKQMQQMQEKYNSLKHFHKQSLLKYISGIKQLKNIINSNNQFKQNYGTKEAEKLYEEAESEILQINNSNINSPNYSPFNSNFKKHKKTFQII